MVEADIAAVLWFSGHARQISGDASPVHVGRFFSFFRRLFSPKSCFKTTICRFFQGLFGKGLVYLQTTPAAKSSNK